MNTHDETSRARAMRLLALVRERTEHTHGPVFVARPELAAACQLSISEAEAAWRYLRDLGLVDTFSVPYTAWINAKGIDALVSLGRCPIAAASDAGRRLARPTAVLREDTGRRAVFDSARARWHAGG